jgi:hypothetical protein
VRFHAAKICRHEDLGDRVGVAFLDADPRQDVANETRQLRFG